MRKKKKEGDREFREYMVMRRRIKSTHCLSFIKTAKYFQMQFPWLIRENFEQKKTTEQRA